MRTNNRRWIDITSNFKSDGDNYFKGERLHEDAEKAARWVKAGWATDVAGELQSGAPDTAPVTLQVQDGIHASAADQA